MVCGGCNTLLMFPQVTYILNASRTLFQIAFMLPGTVPTDLVVMQGAQNVRCARCGHITSVPPAGGEKSCLTVVHIPLS